MIFKSKVEKFSDTKLWAYHFVIQPEIAKKFIEGKNRRVLCSINDEEAFQCAIMHWKDKIYFINLNQELRNRLGLSVGDEINVKLEKDKSEFGLPFPEVFKEVLDTDLEAKRFFEKLTPGKKRNLLYIVNKPKSEEKKIEKSLVIAGHLKKMNGKIDFRLLNEDFKSYRY